MTGLGPETEKFYVIYADLNGRRWYYEPGCPGSVTISRGEALRFKDEAVAKMVRNRMLTPLWEVTTYHRVVEHEYTEESIEVVI